MQQHAIVGGFQGGNLKGFAIIDGVRMPRIQHRARLSSVYVTPDVRGTGAADSMMRWILKEFGRFFTLYRIGVRSDNERAIGFFKKMGFQEIGVEPHAMMVGEEDGKKVFIDELQMYWMAK
jgi:ribosomal protein S18 acetylase RimI-like enzyme